MGSFGPKEINQKNGKPYATSFPIITIQDIVNAQNLLIEHFKIKRLHAVIGGSMGGMQVLAWSVLYPQKLKLAVAMATSYHYTPQNIAFHEVGRQAIMADPNWCGGNYLVDKKYPNNGLALARMTAHITYLSENALQKKFGRNLQNKDHLSFTFDRDFKVENYLHYQGYSFVERFDPNSYLYITKAVDYFDLQTDFNGKLSNAFLDFAKNKDGKFCIISFSDDWLFAPSEAKKLTQALVAASVNVSAITINSNAGHDSFLIESSALKNTVNAFINQ
jgi:homoserine O-acetyltransferase